MNRVCVQVKYKFKNSKNIYDFADQSLLPLQLKIALRNYQSIVEYPMRMQMMLSERAWYENYNPKRVIVREGQKPLNFYFILSGTGALYSLTLSHILYVYNMKTSQMTYTEKISRMKITIYMYIVIQVHSTSVILLIVMSDILFLYMSNEGYFTFIVHHL